MRKARLLYLVDKYENELISSTGKRKEEVGGPNEQIKSKSNVE